MMNKVIEKRNIRDFLRGLCAENLYAPVRDEEGKISFRLIEDPAKIVFEFSNTLKPAKSLLLPQTETIFKVDDEGIRTPEIRKGGIIFGIRPCDAKSIRLLKMVFEKDYEDPYFLQREENFLKMGLACTSPNENCFCTSFGLSPFSSEGLDILFTDIRRKYYVEVFDEKGEKLIENHPMVFSDPTEEDVKSRRIAQRKAEEKIMKRVDVKRASERLRGIFGSTFWGEISNICIGCGICTYLCPTCHCFDLTDERVDGKTIRVRTWDTCMSPYFTLQASGYNPRPTRKERLRNRIYHKFKYLLENIGEFGCVGCGRCLENCPVGVDLTEILRKVMTS